jgi:acyl-CoA dehydrogenase
MQLFIRIWGRNILIGQIAVSGDCHETRDKIVVPDTSPVTATNWFNSTWPTAFSTTFHSEASDAYLSEPLLRKLVEFFEKKGLPAIREEEQRSQWYADWLDYQAKHRLYASVHSPRGFSSFGEQFDLLRYSRFLEVFAYFSPGHAYSLQVTFLGLYSILMGSNDAIKKEAVTALEGGGQFAFGISEKNHGADLFGNEFTIRPSGSGRFVANGSKYYIGNANCASIISMLARKDDPSSAAGREKRVPFVLFALRPKESRGFGNLRKIRTLGVRAGFVGEFDVKDHELPGSDLFADGRGAWEAVMGTVTLGKFFLGFGSVGICEHAWKEAVDYLSRRILYGKPVIEMPHIRSIIAQAGARLTGMKLYAYRALDYVQAARAEDRRYLLYCAVQKAKVSTEGVKVMAQLSECIGAKGFESEETYFEMGLRDAQLIPSLESSAHINLGFAAQFIPRYFWRFNPELGQPASLAGGAALPKENTYLMEARSSAINAITFPPFLRAYRPLKGVANVRIFARQAMALRRFVKSIRLERDAQKEIPLVLGQCIATIAYGQLIAENAVCLGVPAEMVSAIFHLLIADLSASALALAALPELDAAGRSLIGRVIAIPRTVGSDWDFVLNCVCRAAEL